MEENQDVPARAMLAYMDDIQHCRPLSRSQEAELTRRIRTGDEEALEQLITANVRFAFAVAKTYVGQGLSLIELISEANLGLIEAANRFDETRGFKFITYAVWWIRQAIHKALAENNHIVRQPMSRLSDLRRTEQLIERHAQKNGRVPTQHAVEVLVDMSSIRLRGVQEAGQVDISLDAPLAHNPTSTLSERIGHPEKKVDELFEVEELTETLAAYLQMLGGREAWILSVHFGLDGSKPMTLEAIGAKLNLTRERIRQLRNKALAKLNQLHARQLRDFASN